MVIGFTGTQMGMTRNQRNELTLLLDGKEGEFHHGDCIGADAAAHLLAAGNRLRTVIHPPSEFRKRAFCEADESRAPLPYLERNLEIVKCCDMLIAAPSGKKEILRSGTWATVRAARKLGKRVVILDP